MSAHSNSKAKPLFLSGRVVAYLRGDVLDVRRKADGFLTVPPGIAIADAILAQLPPNTTIQVSNLDSGERFYIPLAEFWIHAFPLNRGSEPQHALPFRYWATELRLNSKTLKAGEIRHKAGEPRQYADLRPPEQLGLFKESADSRKWWDS